MHVPTASRRDTGSHPEPIAAGGVYADLYWLHQTAYQS